MQARALLMVLLALSAVAPGQATGQTKDQSQDRAPEHRASPQPAPSLPAPVRLGLRVEQTRLAATLCPDVVIVADGPSYLAAVAGWKPERRYPVLIDDGTPESREDVARFVRAYAPRRVVRWRAPEAPASGTLAKADPGQIRRAVADAWGVAPGASPDAESLAARWKELGHTPPGIVVYHPDDGAWPAAAALAAGRGQLLLVAKAPAGVDALMTGDQADALERAVEAGAVVSGHAWRELGDELDAVTLCLNLPARLDKGASEHLAVTDLIGREPGEPKGPGSRWAWAGQVFGSPSASAYRAMCSLFLQPAGAWLFDGYPASAPWNAFDVQPAAELFRRVGLAAETLDAPRQGLRDWIVRAARPVDAGLVVVTSKGNNDFFDLEPGRAKPGHVPILSRPAAVVFVHSWSASTIGRRDGVGGRWLERGAFCYAGSVHEPLLSAFVPTPALAGRMVSRAPFGAAARVDGAKAWKVAIVGDPLFTLGPGAPRDDGPLPLGGARDVQGGLRELLTGERFGEAMEALVLSGRDADAARLGATLLDQPGGALSPEAAAWAMTALFRTGDSGRTWKAFARMADAAQGEGWRRDYLWHSATPLLEGTPEPALLDLLRANIRQDQVVSDAMRLGAAWARTRGMASASEMLRSVRDQVRDAGVRDHLDRAMRQPPAAWGP